MNIFKKEGSEYSLSKIMAAIAFAVSILIILLELLTTWNCPHCSDFLMFTGGLVALAVGRSSFRQFESAKVNKEML